MTTTNAFDRELTETELSYVVGGDVALQHESGHAADPPHTITFGNGRTPVAIIAILIGMLRSNHEHGT